MAFYDNYGKSPRQDKRKMNGNWEEEGSRYQGQYAPRYRKAKNGSRSGAHAPGRFRRDDDMNRSESNSSYAGPRHGGPQRRYPSSYSRGENRYPDRRKMRPVPEEEVRQEKSYREFEHVPQTPPKEENLPADNLLVGRNPIREALKGGRDLEKLLVAKGELQGSAREILQLARDAHVVVQEVDKSKLDDIAPHHQGMIAYASAYHYAQVADILQEARDKGEDPFIIVLDGVTDPHNLGAIIRSAECAGAHGVIVPERRSVGLTPAAVKASAGAIEFLKVARVPNLNRTLEELKREGMWIYAMTMEGKDYKKIDFRGPCVLVIGSEGEGISRLVLENSDVQVSLPMRGHIESLNASVAAGIIMYRVLDSRRA